MPRAAQRDAPARTNEVRFVRTSSYRVEWGLARAAQRDAPARTNEVRFVRTSSYRVEWGLARDNALREAGRFFEARSWANAGEEFLRFVKGASEAGRFFEARSCPGLAKRCGMGGLDKRKN